MKTKTLLKNLRSHLKRAQSQDKTTATDANADKAEDIVGGIFDILEYLPPDLIDIDAWLDRPIYGREAPRQYLDRIRTTYYQPQGRKALCGLLAVVIEVLEAAKWLEDVHVGSLPVKVRVPEQGSIGHQKIVQIDRHDAVDGAAESLGIGDHRKQVRTALNRQDEQSYQDHVLTCFDPQKHGVLTTGIGPDSDFAETSIKVCRSCRESKLSTDFYAHPKTADRRQNECKDCNKDRIRRRRSEVCQ